ncbi:ribonuclease H-like domain-containing protein [Tanacetum coccineum]
MWKLSNLEFGRKMMRSKEDAESLLSQLEIHGAGVSTEDANQKYLRSLPSAWSQVSLIMRTKPGVDSLNFDDLYNNLRVFESDDKGSTASSSSTQNVAFVSENTSSTNDVSTAYGVSKSSGHNSQYEHTSLYSLLANQSSCPQLDHEDLEQIDEFNLEEMDLKWQVAMISMRMKKFYKKTSRKLQFDAKEPVGFDKTKVECYSCHKTGHFASRRIYTWNTRNKDKENGRRSDKQEDSKALVTLDREGVDWTSHSEDEQENYALMAYSSSGSDTELFPQPPMTGNYILLDLITEIDDSQFTYGPKQSKPSESDARSSDFNSCESNIVKKHINLMPEPVVNEPKVASEPKVWSDAPIIEEVNTAEVNANNVDKGKRGNGVNPQQVVNWKTKEALLAQSLQIQIVDQSYKLCSFKDPQATQSKKIGTRTGNKAYLLKIKTLMVALLLLEEVQMCDKKNKVLFTDSECLVLSLEFKLPDEKQVLHRIPRQNNMYSFNLEIIVLSGGKQHKASCKAKTVSSISQPLQLLHMDLFGHDHLVLVTKPQNKTPYELVTGKIPIISYIRPFGCHVTILNTIDHLGKFDGKSDEGFLVGYSLQSKAFRVYNLETKRVEENLHITFLENKPNVAGKGPTWLFDLDYLTDSMNYQPVRSENQANKHAGPQEANQNAGTEDNIDAGDSEIEAESAQDYFVLPIWSSYTSTVKSSKVNNAGEEPTKHPDFKQVDKEDQVFLDELERLKRQEQDANDAAEALRKEFAQETEDLLLQAGAAKASSTNIVNTASTPVSTASPYGGLSFTDLTNTDQDDSKIHALEEIYDNSSNGIFTNSSYDDEGAVADFTNFKPVVNVSPIPTSRIHSIHPSTLILGDPQSAVQTRSKVTKNFEAYAFICYIQKQWRNNHKDF